MPHFTAIHSIVVTIFHSELKCWIDRLMDGPALLSLELLVCLKMATIIIISLYSSAQFIMAGDGSPPAHNEKITGTEKIRERGLCVCLGGWCVCVSGVQMKWRILGNQGRVKGKGQSSPLPQSHNTLWLSAFILSTYQYSADHPCLLLSGWN